jgi:ATP-dependent DNA helicase RecQ
MARRRPSTPDRFLQVKGVGQQKCQHYGRAFLETIREYCQAHLLEMDTKPIPAANLAVLRKSKSKSSNLSEARSLAFELFKQKYPVNKVATAIKRAGSTTVQYLIEYIQREKTTTPLPWVDEPTFKCIVDAAEQAGVERMKPVFDFLQGQVGYDQIRISLACLRNRE